MNEEMEPNKTTSPDSAVVVTAGKISDEAATTIKVKEETAIAVTPYPTDSGVSPAEAKVLTVPSDAPSSANSNAELYEEYDYCHVSKLDSEIHDMISNPDFIELRHWMQDQSFFSVVGRTHTEMWHSSFIAWLLNPQGHHMLGYFPIKCLLSAMRKKAVKLLKDDTENKDMWVKIEDALPNQEIIDTWWFDNCVIMPDCNDENLNREKMANGKNRLDIAFTLGMKNPLAASKYTKRLLFICENKINSYENDAQTERYVKWAETEATFPLSQTEDDSECRPFKIKRAETTFALLYLTPSGGRPTSEKFLPMSYQELMDNVLIPCSLHPSLSSDGKSLLLEYMHTLDRKNLAVSAKVKKLCQDLIDKYPKVLLSFFKVILYSDAFSDLNSKDANQRDDILRRLSWLSHFCNGISKVQLGRSNGVDDFVLEQDKNKLSIISYRKKISNAESINIYYNDKAENLYKFWEEYTKHNYMENKISYAVGVMEKYRKVWELLAKQTESVLKEKADDKEHWSVLFQKILYSLLNNSKSWVDWSSYSEQIKKFVGKDIQTDDNAKDVKVYGKDEKGVEKSDIQTDDDAEYVKVYGKDEKGVEKSADMQLIKRPLFFACENDKGSVIKNADGINGSKFVKLLDKNQSKPWASVIYVKGKKGGIKYLSEFIK